MTSIVTNTLLPAGYLLLANTINFRNFPQLHIDAIASQPLNQFNLTKVFHKLLTDFRQVTVDFADPKEALQSHSFEVGLAALIGLTTTVTDQALKRMPGSDKVNPSFRRIVSLLVGTGIVMSGVYAAEPNKVPLSVLTSIATKVGFTAIGVKAATTIAIGGLQATRLSSKLITRVIEKTCDVAIFVLNGCNLLNFSEAEAKAKITNNNATRPPDQSDPEGPIVFLRNPRDSEAEEKPAEITAAHPPPQSPESLQPLSESEELSSSPPVPNATPHEAVESDEDIY